MRTHFQRPPVVYLDDIIIFRSDYEEHLENKNPFKVATIRETNLNKSTPWLSKYSTKQISPFQRENPDFSYLHKWIDQGKIPDRDSCACLSTAVRRYWLHWDNLSRKDEIIYHRWREVD